PEHVVTVTECLVLATPAAGQVYGPVRDGEGIAMPVQHGRGVVEQSADRVVAAGVGTLHRKPADLAFRVAAYWSAQHPGDQLGSQAHAEYLLAVLDALADEALLVVHPGITMFVVGSHG